MTPALQTTPCGSRWLPVAPNCCWLTQIHAVYGSHWLPSSHRVSLLPNHYPEAAEASEAVKEMASQCQQLEESRMDAVAASEATAKVSAKTQITPTRANDSQWLTMAPGGSCSYKRTLFVAPNGFQWLPMTLTA